MYTRFYWQRLYHVQQELRDVGLKAFILTYKIFSDGIIVMERLAKYSQLEMLLRALPRYLTATGIMLLKQHPRDPSTFKYEKPRKHFFDKSVNADALTLQDSERAHTAPGVSPYSIPAGVSLLQLPVVITFPAISSEETLAPAQAMEDIPIAKTNNTIDTKIDHMMKVLEVWTCQPSQANEPRYVG